MGFFSWLFGKKKKVNVDVDLDAEIDSISFGEKNEVEDNAQVSATDNAAFDSKVGQNTSAKANGEPNARTSAKASDVVSTKANASNSSKIDAKASSTVKSKSNGTSASSAKASSNKNEEVTGEKGSTRGGAIEVYKDTQGKFRFRIKASNACTVAHSQGYTSKAACKNGFVSISKTPNIIVVDTIIDKDYLPTIGKAVFEIYRDKEDKFRFRYRAANLNTTLASQGYTTKANCINGINSVQKLLTNYVIDDLTKK